MAHDLHFDKKGLDLILPLGLSIFRFGNLIYFACIIIFLSQMYDVPLNFADYIFIILGSMIAASAAAATGIINLKLISIMAIPLGIPIELGLILFASIDAFIDPFRTLCTVFVNAATAAISVDVNLNENNEV